MISPRLIFLLRRGNDDSTLYFREEKTATCYEDGEGDKCEELDSNKNDGFYNERNNTREETGRRPRREFDCL